MSNLWVEETWINADKGYGAGESGVYETYTDDRGELFRAMQKQYGRCVGKFYIGDGVGVGWVFNKRTKYDDSPETFLLETWVAVHTGPPTRTVEYNYAVEV